MAASLLGAAASSAQESRSPLDIETALVQAFRASPVLRARRAELELARADLVIARTYPFNPTLEVAAGDRTSGDRSTTEKAVELSQVIEVRGQRSKRRDVATVALEAAENRLEREHRLLAAQVRQAFAEAIRQRNLLAIAQADAELAQSLLRFEERRLEAGAGTQIELNLGRSAAGRAQRTLRLAEAREQSVRHRLAELIGLDPAQPPVLHGDLPQPEGELPPLPALLASARRNRADLIALRKESEAAERAIRLEKARSFPSLNLAAFYEEEGTDEILGLKLTVPLPLFNRNPGGILALEAIRDRFTAETDVASLEIEREVADALAIYRAAVAAAQTLRDLVIGTLEQDLGLLQRSLEAGRINAIEVLVFRREFVEAQREYTDALADAWMARILLDLAAGTSSYPTETEEVRR